MCRALILGESGAQRPREPVELFACLRQRNARPRIRREQVYTGMVRIWLELPDGADKQLVEGGKDLSRAALEALAIDAYRMRRITGFELCQLLGIPSRYELDGFLKQHGVPLEYGLQDFEEESATSHRLWQKRQQERDADVPRERSFE